MMNFFIITTTIFLFFSHATLTLGMAIDSSASVSELEDKGVYTAIFELDPQIYNPIDTFRFDPTIITSNVDGSGNDDPKDDPKDAGPTPTLSRRDLPLTTLTCETSDASPYVNDIYDTADWMGNPKLQGKWDCRQTNPGGSMCKRVQWSGSAAAGICGPWGVIARCGRLADGVRAIADRCARNGKAGGKIVYTNTGYTLIVYKK